MGTISHGSQALTQNESLGKSLGNIGRATESLHEQYEFWIC